MVHFFPLKPKYSEIRGEGVERQKCEFVPSLRCYENQCGWQNVFFFWMQFKTTSECTIFPNKVTRYLPFSFASRCSFHQCKKLAFPSTFPMSLSISTAYSTLPSSQCTSEDRKTASAAISSDCTWYGLVCFTRTTEQYLAPSRSFNRTAFLPLNAWFWNGPKRRVTSFEDCWCQATGFSIIRCTIGPDRHLDMDVGRTFLSYGCSSLLCNFVRKDSIMDRLMELMLKVVQCFAWGFACDHHIMWRFWCLCKVWRKGGVVCKFSKWKKIFSVSLVSSAAATRVDG